jgi:ornithine carbamoyltransferase
MKTMKDLLRTADLSPADLNLLLDLSDDFKNDQLLHYGALQGSTVVLYFGKPSTRTRLSFEAAVAALGGIPSTVGPAELQLSRGETIEDTAKVVSRYAKAFVIRTFAHDDVRLVAEAASIPVINALTDEHHPCQSVADALTLRQKFGTLKGLKVAFVGPGNNVVHSLAEACALAGIDLTIASPPGYQPNPTIISGAQTVAQAHGGSVTLTTDPMSAVSGAAAVYTDTWVSMGDSEAQRADRLAALAPFKVGPSLMKAASNEAIFMHCLPAHRGEEVLSDVIDGPRSVVFDQAENRMHTAQALLYALKSGMLMGAAVAQPAAVETSTPTAVGD